MPSTRPTPSSRIARRRSATSLKKDWASGNPSVTTAPSTLTGLQARIKGLVGGLLLTSSTISGQRSSRSWRVGPVRALGAGRSPGVDWAAADADGAAGGAAAALPGAVEAAGAVLGNATACAVGGDGGGGRRG